ncbi:hypothetical protein TNCV_4593051, partial [Trichonephila clavipes]
TSKSDDSDSSTDSDEENILELLRGDGTSEDDSFMEDPDRAEALRQETTGRILDCIFLPREGAAFLNFVRGGKSARASPDCDKLLTNLQCRF